MVRLISLEGCPADFGSELTRAANTQNKIEKRDFAALDEQQNRLRTDLLLSYQKEYVYRTGDRPPVPENGCTLDEATVALACAQQDVGYSMMAKREVSSLYDDIKQPPYTVLFNASVSVLRLLRAVQVMREVDAVLKQEQSQTDGKNRLIAIHGNRFVLYLVFRRFGAILLDENKVDVTAEICALSRAATNILAKVIDATISLYPNAYPSNCLRMLRSAKP
jgi:hypothetical protein